MEGAPRVQLLFLYVVCRVMRAGSRTDSSSSRCCGDCGKVYYGLEALAEGCGQIVGKMWETLKGFPYLIHDLSMV